MLRADEISKRFPNGFLALDGISLDVAPGEIVGIVGGSGCGKSTLLRLMSGLDQPTHGGIELDGQPVRAPRLEIGVVFQEPRLMPWLTVEDNVQFGIAHLPAAERRRLTAEALEKVGLSRFARALPRELSGGMAQRSAIARALVTKPAVMLLDEPFSALDALTRQGLQEHLLQIWAYDRPTMVLVTHDIDEALTLSDRVVVMRGQPGQIHGVFSVPLPKPRARNAPQFQSLREELLRALQITLHAVHAQPPSYDLTTRLDL